MATLVIKNIPDELHQALKELAITSNRSMNGQMIYLMKQFFSSENINTMQEITPPYIARKPLTQKIINQAQGERK